MQLADCSRSMRRQWGPGTQGLPIGQGSRRGFTLIELSVVVLIITVFAGLAIPTIVTQMRDRRLQQAARDIASLYRQARLRALGRGSAVLVTFTGGAYTVREARMGLAAPSAACGDLPVASCTATSWDTDPAASRLVDRYGPAASGELASLSLGVVDSGGNAQSALEICFTPMGRSFVRELVTQPFLPLTATYLASVSRPGHSRTRHVVFMPNGTARLTQ
jgi:prepilin-type N-terminal cleavage/methylation domain-containing protein